MKRIMSFAIVGACIFGVGGYTAVVASEQKPVAPCVDRQKNEYDAKVIRVVDGDTIDAMVNLGFNTYTHQRLRLARVDTPERNQPRFLEAKNFTESMIGGKDVVLRIGGKSKYGYYLADVMIEGQSMSDALITAGLGRPYDGGAK